LSADTSVPKQREAGLGEFESWLPDAVLRDAPAGMAFIDTDLRFVWVNPALARMYDRPVNDFAGQPIAAVWPAVDAARAEAALQQVLGQGRPATETFEAGAAAAAGAAVTGALPGPQAPQALPVQRTFHWFGVRGANGALCGAGLIVIAGGTGPATEEALRRSEERYRALVQGGAQIIWVASPDGEMLEDSAEWRWITGQSVEEFLGNGWLDSIHPEDRERVERDWRECLRTGRIFDDRFRMRARGGAYRHYDVRAVPIERDGKIAEWVGACTDVTSQREAEEMRGRLTDQLSAAALRTARLQQATAMLAEALDVEQVVEVITEVGRTAIGALRSAVALLNDDKLGLRVVNRSGLAPTGPDGAGVRLTLDTPSVMTRAIATRRPVLIADPEELRSQFDSDPAADGQVLDTGDEQAWVGLPLLAAGMPLGALRFSFGKPRTILEEERVFLEALAGQCALAVERAEMYEKEHTAAVTLQRSLLPGELPSVAGLTLDARYLPRSMDVGGDWYDVFRLPDRRLAVTVGDVMGKGLLAAAGMGRVRNALRALALTDPRPAAVLAGLDRLFAATELEDYVTTVTYLVIDPETGEGQAGNAGHPPTLLLTPGALPVLDGAEAGTPLGWASPRRQHAFRLPPGSTAVFYSDGLVENRMRGLDSGLDELVRIAADAPQDLLGEPGRLLQYLLDNMLAGYEQDDDVTMLVMHVPAGTVFDKGSPDQQWAQR
jgi:PAS domain S-box-containing protein